MVGPVTNEDLSISPNTDNIQQQQHYRLQLLAQAIEKVENESLQNTLAVSSSPITSKKQQQSIPIDSLSMPSSQQQQQELLIKLLTQQNVAAVMAAAAAAQLQVQQQQQQQQKIEPISPPSTSSASSTSESPIDFSSHRSIDDNNDCSTPSSPLPNQQQLLSTMLQNLQSTSPTSSFPFLLTNKNGKPTRPFKAYPREPLMLPLGFCPTTATEQTNILAEAASRTTSNRKRLAQTQERLKQRLQQQQQQQQQSYFISSSGTQILQPPKKRHRTMETTSISEDNTTTTTTTTENNNNNSSTNNDDPNNTIKDDAYWERRRKNNEAAKRSRDARRAKEDEIAIRAAILEQENIKLRLEVSQLKQETAKLRCMIPSIAFRLDISADIADHMEQNEENINKNQQELFLKYFIEAIQKQQQQQQQQVGSIDFSTRINQYNKLIRPFSSYSLTDNHLNSNENILQQFYKHLLKNVNQQDQYVSSISTNSISIKKDYKLNTSLPSPKNQDDVYWERRKKNNEAAKRSRDARRAKEDEIALRAAWLEQENVKLRLENAHLKQENIQLRCQIYRSNKS
ncbi:unnamed protein product [Rotaria sp. Silwood1]|nr:unnamed protein product [Rotaria sp. Silwood1]CAF3430748.1 unnamed protein product [Rotaria sp. Silwood1]CAF4909918.1 unnamed protein product [Rotaria sp. Silwood1]